jgi:peptidoglycan hydrolase-like protein with peptidoglycan-binding domain
MAAGAAVGALCTALLLVSSGAGPGSRADPGREAAVLTGSLELSPAPAGGASAPLAPASERMTQELGESGAPDDLALRVEQARSGPEARDARDRDPRLAAAGVAPTPVDPETAAAVEAALRFSRSERRELQRRLALAEHDPRLVDGIFGPATRAAIAAWQRSAGLPPTGYIDVQALALLEDQTDERYRAWEADNGDRRQRTRTASAGNAVPPGTPAAANCRRLWSGEIAYGHTFRCDVRGLRENVAELFRGLEPS